MADSSSVQLAYVKEDTFGVKKTGSALQVLRNTGESLKQDSTTQASSEIRSDRQISDVKRTGIGVSGSVSAELSFGTYDELLEAGLMSAGWSSPVTVGPAATIDFEVASGVSQVINDSGNGFGTVVANQWVKISGASNAANNGIFKVTAVAAGSITVQNANGVLEAVGSSITIVMGAQIINGSTKSSFNFEREYTDLSNELALYLGCMIGGFDLNVALESIISCGLNITGKKAESLTSSGGSGYTDANANEVIDSIDEISVIVDGVAQDGTSMSVQVNNNLRPKKKLGHSGPMDIGLGTLAVSGNAQVYFESQSLFNKYLAFSEISLALVIKDGAGNAYVADLPRAIFTDGNRTAGSKDQDMIADMTWQAYRHATEDITIRLVKFPAA